MHQKRGACLKSLVVVLVVALLVGACGSDPGVFLPDPSVEDPAAVSPIPPHGAEPALVVDRPVTRSAMSSFLHAAFEKFHSGNTDLRSLGSDLFGDVPRGSQHDETIGWAVSNNIMTVSGDEPFNPDRNVTRGEAADYFIRLWELLGNETSTDNERLLFFTELDRDVGYWAELNIDGSELRYLMTNDHETEFESPAISPDGRRVAFQDEYLEIWVMNINGTDLKRLTADDYSIYLPFWSPDGNAIAYTRDEDLWTADPISGESRQLSNTPEREYALRWSPDGNAIVYISDGDLWTADPISGESRQLSNTPEREHAIGWSPDGNALLYFQDDQLWVVSADGTEPRQLTTEISTPYQPRWSPDGNALLYFQDDQLWVVSADGTELRQLATEIKTPYQPQWSPDGNTIAFISDRVLWVVSADGTELRQLATEIRTLFQFQWSPDGNTIAYRSNSGVWTSDVNSGESHQLTEALLEESLRWSPDGNTIALVLYDGRKETVWLVNPDGSNLRKTAIKARSLNDLEWSPDGTHLAYVTYSKGSGSELFISGTDWETPRNLTGHHDRANADPQWTADSERLSFVSNRTGNYEVWVMNPDNGESRQLTSTPDDESTPRWSPDGQRGVYTLGGDLWMIDSDSGESRQLTSTPDDESTPRWSPDGLSIAYTVITYTVDDGEPWVDDYDLWVIDPNSGQSLQLTDSPYLELSPSWSPDSQKIAYVGYGEVPGGGYSPLGRIWVMTPDGTNKQQLTGHEDGTMPEGGVRVIRTDASNPQWSPDGNLIVFSSGVTLQVMNPDGTNRQRLSRVEDHRLTSGSPLWAPNPHSSARFADVPIDHPQNLAVSTAVSYGMMAPSNKTTFRVDDPVTFAETAAAFYRFAVIEQLPPNWDSHPLTPNVDDRYEFDLVWSPDGTQGALFASGWDTNELRTVTGETILESDQLRWQPLGFSRDNTTLFYAEGLSESGFGEGFMSIKTASPPTAQGTHVTVFESEGEGFLFPSLSNDGAYISLQSKVGSFQVLNTETGGVQEIADSEYLLLSGWSPDGRLVYHRGEQAELHTMLPDGSDDRPLLNEPLPDQYVGAWDPKWSPDGTQVMFTATDSTGWFDFVAETLVMTSEGKNIRPAAEGITIFDPVVSQSLLPVTSAAWSPDGVLIALSGSRTDDDTVDLWVVNNDDGSEPRLIVANKEAILVDGWSPDGTQVVFAVDDPAGVVYHAVKVRTGQSSAPPTHPFSEAIDWVIGSGVMALPDG